MYQLYVQNRAKEWSMIRQDLNLDNIKKEMQKIDFKKYIAYKITKEKEIIEEEILSEECPIVYVDNLKTKVIVKGLIFQPERAKRKQILRKEIENYIDR